MSKESSIEKCVLIPFIKYQRLMKHQQNQSGAGEIDNKRVQTIIKPETEVSSKVRIIPPPPGKTDTVSIQDKSEINSWIDNWSSVGFIK